MTYEETKNAVFDLSDTEQDKLMKELAVSHIVRKAKARAASSTGWKQKAWAGVAIAAAALTAAAATFGLTSCTVTPEQASQIQRIAQGVAPLIVIVSSEK